MATSILSQLSHGRCDGDKGRLTNSPSGPRTLRKRELCSSPWYTDHDTDDVGQSGQSESQSAGHQDECHVREEADAHIKPGLTTVTLRHVADVTIVQNFTPIGQRISETSHWNNFFFKHLE